MNVPELRFPEFEDEWEEKLLSEIAETIDGDRSHRYPNEKDLKKDGIIFLSTSNIINNKLDFSEKRFISKEKFNELKKGHLEKNDLIVTLRGSIGNIVSFENNVYPTGFINAQMMIIRLKKEMPIHFIHEWYLSPKTQNKILKISSGSAQPQLTKSDINNLKIQIPSIPEQEKIASFLSRIDLKIEYLERKVELWQFYKKGMLQQLFSQELRFRAGDGSDFPDWEEKELGKISKKIRNKNKNNETNIVFSNSAINGLVLQKDFFDKNIANQANLEGYYLVKPEYFVYNPRISKFAPVGPINVNKTGIIGLVSPLYTVFSIEDKNIDVSFLEMYFSSIEWHSYMRSVANYGARHDRMNITDKDFFEMPILIPSLEEQTKIAQFLTIIDKKIESIQKELQLNKEFKKGLLQKMFPTDKKSKEIKTPDLLDKQTEQIALL